MAKYDLSDESPARNYMLILDSGKDGRRSDDPQEEELQYNFLFSLFVLFHESMD